jgi:hypothetical protein
VGFGVGFRVAPGVRLRATRRGPRVSLGPRIARLHVGGGTSAVSAGSGPLTVWSTLSGGGHTSTGPSGTDRKAAEWSTVRDHLDGLLEAHTAPVERARRPIADPPQPVDRRAVRHDLRSAARDGLAWWQLGARRRAHAAADARLDDEVTRRQQLADRVAADAQADADAWWQRLLANDPQVVTTHLERALADHAMPATVTAVEDDRAHLVIPVLPPEELVGVREPTLTDKGNLSLARMTKTRRHELYQAAIGSAMLAVAAEAFALAPGLAAVDLAVVDPAHLGGPAVLRLAELPRASVLPDGADRPVIDDVVLAATRGEVTLVQDRGARVGALRPLDDEDPDVRALLDVLEMD